MKLLWISIAIWIHSLGSSQEVGIDIWDQTTIPYRIESDESELREVDGILRISQVQFPTIDVYLPAPGNRSGQAVLILPGGGYQILAYHWEGSQFARWLQAHGIAAVVLKYRLPVSRSLTEPHRAPISDAQRAMRFCRSRAKAWGIDPDKIGVMGFSAGGHLAATLSTQYDAEVYRPVDSTDDYSARPAFTILAYPVITFMGADAHAGSRKALLGAKPADSLLRFFSPERQVDARTPPAFLLHASDDTGVPPGNSLLYYRALSENRVPASLHIYPEGGHGFAMGENTPLLKDWPGLLLAWIRCQ